MKGIIYKIFRESEPNTVYLGSSLNSKEHRMAEHKKDFKAYLNGNFPYVSSFEILKYPDAVIKVVATVEVENEQELRKEEDKYIVQYKNDANYKVVNVRRAYIEDKKEATREKTRRYREKHKDELKQKIRCTCGSTFKKENELHHNKTQKHVQYILNNCNVTINN